MLLPEATNAIGLRFTDVGLLVSRLPFDPVELLEEPESLLRRAAAILSRLEGINKAPPGVSQEVVREIWTAEISGISA